MRTALSALFLILLGAPAHAQVLQKWQGGDFSFFGWEVEAAGDVDQDGVPDVLVGAPQWIVNPGYRYAGSAVVLSGANGHLIHQWFGTTDKEEFGIVLAGLGDLNGDGHADVAVGAPGDDTNDTDSGAVHVYSGIDGSELFVCRGTIASARMGRAVAAAGDANGDGVPDLLVSLSGAASQIVRLYSGADGAVLQQTFGQGNFGRVIAGIGDVDGDNHDDFAAGRTDWGPNLGRIRVVSGATGAILYNLDGTDPDRKIGGYLVGLGADLNADSVPDFAGTDWARNSGEDYGRIYSGADGSTILALDGDFDVYGSAATLNAAGDVDGDGIQDVIMAEPESQRIGPPVGTARIFSGADGSILATYDGPIDPGGGTQYQAFGRGLAGVGDVNLDGYDDVAIGAPYWGPGDGLVTLLAGGIPYVLSDPQPGQAGVPNTLTVTGAEPGHQVFFLAGKKSGISTLPCQSGYFVTAFKDAIVLASRTANGVGTASLTANAPNAVAGRTLRLQAYSYENCRFSELKLVAFP